jgi:hypothetical protein
MRWRKYICQQAVSVKGAVMKQNNIEKMKEERGEIMLESSFILVSVIVLLLALLSISFMFYQQAMMTSVANEIAADIAKNYKYTNLDIAKNYKYTNLEMDIDPLTIDEVKGTGMFRMSFGMNKLEEEHKNRAETYANERIQKTSLGLNPKNIIVDCKITRSGIGRAYVKVTVSQETDFFLSGILDMVGVADKNSTFSATAYAECVDMMGYTSMVNFAEYVSKKLNVFNSVGNLYESVKKFKDELLK